MGTGYTRNDTSNNIADGNIINAADLDGEFDAIESAMGTSGHTHDGTSAEGGPVTVLGPVQDFVASATEIKPKTTNTLDIGTSGLLFKDMFLDGVATVGSIKIDNAGTIGSASDGDAIAISSSGVVSFSQNTIGKTGSGYVLSLQTSDTTIEATNVLGKIEFSAPDEASGTDAILVGASIEALAEDTFDSSTNSTALVFKTNTTGAATERMRLTSAGDLHFLDNRKAIFGAGSDLQIYHDGSNSYISEQGVGSLYVQATNLIVEATDGSNYLTAVDGGAVKLYYADTASNEKLATTSTGIDVTGTITFDGGTTSADLNFGDNDKAIFGAGSDLQIYHDGSDSFITDTGAGNLQIWGGNFRLRSSDGSEAVIDGNSGGAVTLYYNNAPKLATTSTGIDVTGTVTSDGLTVDGATGQITLPGATPVIEIGAAGSTNTNLNLRKSSSGTVGINFQRGTNPDTDFRIFMDSSENINFDWDYSSSIGANRAITFTAEAGANNLLKIDTTGNISFYEDTGTTAKFFWDASAEMLTTSGLTVDKTATISTTDYYASSTFSGTLKGAATNTKAALLLNSVSSSGQNAFASIHSEPIADFRASLIGTYSADGSGAGYFAINQFIPTSSTTLERMRIDSSGDVSFSGSSGTAGTVKGNGTVTISDNHGSNNGGGLAFHYTGNSGYSQVYVKNNNTLIFDADPTAVGGSTNIEFNIDGSEAMRITSSGNVGIGNTSSGYVFTSGETRLAVGDGSEHAAIQIYSGTTKWGGLEFADDATNGTGQGFIGYYHPSNYMQFNTSGSERMRIDSSGNLLVGTTDTSLYNNTSGGGLAYRPNNELTIAAETSPQFIVNNTGSDGEMIRLAKDGSTVGSIATKDGDIAIGTSGVGLRFGQNAGDSIRPHSMSTNGGKDNSLDLGSSGARFKDLYLSGGVYLGGTGSANHLDDYEEGTWTPVVYDTNTSGHVLTLNNIIGKYKKIGNWVNCTLQVGRNDATSLSGVITITNLPFTVAAQGSVTGGTFWLDKTSSDRIGVVYVVPSADRFYLLSDHAVDNYLLMSEWQNTRPIYIQVSYNSA